MITLQKPKGGCGLFRQKSVASFSAIRLKISGMRITEVYEILCRGEETEISQYWLRYENHEEKYELQKRAIVPSGDMLTLLNRCRILKWDGFSGKNPPHVLDGTMFEFTATVNGGRKIRASGSNNFPKDYHDFTGALYRMLNQP